MAILLNKVLYVLDNNNQYQEFHTVRDEVFLTADKVSNDIYQLYGSEYETAVTSPTNKRVVRVFLLNKDETLSEDISEHVLSWDLDFRYQQGITRTGNLTLMNYKSEWNPNPLNHSIWKGSKFKIDIGIYYNDIVFWKECGIFVCGDISVDEAQGIISFPIYDKFALLDGTVSGKRISRFEIPVGTPVKTAITSCLNTPKDDIGEPESVPTLPAISDAKKWATYELPNGDIYRFNGARFVKISGEVFDTKTIIFPRKYMYNLIVEKPQDWNTKYTNYYTKSGGSYSPIASGDTHTWATNTYYSIQKTPYTISKDENGNLGEIIVELADMISCDVSYNTSGNLTLTEGAITNDDLLKRPVLWDFKEIDGFHSRPVYDIKFSSLVNQIIIAGSIENGYQHKAIVVNDNPRSQANIYMIDPSPLYIEDTQLTTDQLCETRGRYEMIKQGRLSVQLKFNSIFIPHLECNNLITLSDDKLGFNNDLFVINSIEIGADMNMSLSVSSVNEVSF